MRPTKLTVRNEEQATRLIRATIDEIAAECGLGADERFDLKLAATEAVTNALKTAPEDPSVDVRIIPGDESVEVEVADRGSFEPVFRVDADGGRGIPLMLALVDEVEFTSSARGTRVRMRKRITRLGDQSADL